MSLCRELLAEIKIDFIKINPIHPRLSRIHLSLGDLHKCVCISDCAIACMRGTDEEYQREVDWLIMKGKKELVREVLYFIFGDDFRKHQDWSFLEEM